MVADIEEKAVSVEGLAPKERIFHAVMSVALRKGFGKVALSLVAREAGLSKGGLLHHFATKDDLIRAMLAFYADWAVRHTRHFQSGETNASTSAFDPFAVAVLIAAAENPALLEPLREALQSVESKTGGNQKPTRHPLPLLGNLANRLDFVAVLSNRW